jgi:Domain of unknown function (DUF4276)
MTVYIEGGGDNRALQAPARKAFRELFQRAGIAGRLPSVVACGTRSQALRNFQLSIANGEEAVLLVDSEAPVLGGATGAAHLKSRKEWSGAATEERIHLMVQVMETWFLTQPEVLEQYFGSDFVRSRLPRGPLVESIEKQKVLQGLDDASKSCQAGSYSKSKRRGFEILERLEPNKIEAGSPFAAKFFEFLRQHCK